MNIEVQMFGAFRALGTVLHLQLPEGATVQNVREQMVKEVAEMDLDELLQLSKFANEYEVLRDDSHCTDGQILAILPPVSGG